MDDKIYYHLALNYIPKLGPVRKKKLLEYYKKPEIVLNQSASDILRVLGVNIKDFHKIFNRSYFLNMAEEEYKKALKKDIKILTIDDDDFPKILKELPDAPTVLYCKGEIREKDENAVAIVGTRTPTKTGLELTYQLAKELSDYNLSIISGMAKGIDAQAHKGALESGGRTIAVLGCGVDRIYPYLNKKLYFEICEKGAVISEFPIGTEPKSYNFPQRNRIIAGLSAGVIVTEGSEDSGALITAKYGLEYGKEIFALPGSPNYPSSKGTNKLIKQGAKLVENSDDVIKELQMILPLEKSELKHNEEIKLDLIGDELAIYNILDPMNKKHLDEIILESDMETKNVISILTILEFKDKCIQLMGKYYIRK